MINDGKEPEMGMFYWLSSIFDDSNGLSSAMTNPVVDTLGRNDSAINPANGLPMIDGCGGIDVAGNPYGFDFSHDSFDMSSSSIGSSFDPWSD